MSSDEQATRPPEPILELATAFLGSRALMTAVELELFDELEAAGGMTRAEIEDHYGFDHHHGVRDFLDVLVSHDLLERAGETYRTTPLSGRYLTAGEEYVGDWARINAERMYESARWMERALATGTPQNELADEDGSLYQAGDLYADEEGREGFQEAMRSLSWWPTEWIVAEFDWESYDRVCELGAAKGVLSRKIAEATETTETVGFDLPDARPGFEAHALASDDADRISFVEGNFFEDEFPPADAYTYGHILNDWDPDEKRFLVEKAYEALPEGGSLFVHETIVDDERRENRVGLYMNMVTMVEMQGGYCATRGEYATLLDEVGFDEVTVHDIPGAESVVVGRK